MYTETDINRLSWHCRRGMLELDVLLIPFLKERFRTLPLDDQQRFEKLIACEDQDIFRMMAANDVEVLQHRISGTLVPGGFDPLLCRQQFDKLVEFAPEKSPAALDVTDQRMGLVLGDHTDLPYARVDAVGQWKIDNPEFPAKGDGGLGTPFGEIVKPGTASPGEYQSKCLASEATDKTLGRMHESFPANHLA